MEVRGNIASPVTDSIKSASMQSTSVGGTIDLTFIVLLTPLFVRAYFLVSVYYVRVKFLPFLVDRMTAVRDYNIIQLGTLIKSRNTMNCYYYCSAENAKNIAGTMVCIFRLKLQPVGVRGVCPLIFSFLPALLLPPFGVGVDFGSPLCSRATYVAVGGAISPLHDKSCISQ